jgi:predicted AlkP superfamily pyrophosphatase or phosphodiesterase
MSRTGRLLPALACLLLMLLAGAPAGVAATRHVVVVVWDGMRPDFVSPQYTPALHEMARRGTFFRRHHCSYISSTEVNGTALATGAHPEHSGVLANSQYRPDLSWLGPFGTEHLDPVRRGDLLTGGRYLAVPTVPEILQSVGIPTVVAGSKGVTLLHDRLPRGTNDAQRASVNVFRGVTLPRSVLETLKKDPAIGAPPLPAVDTASNKEQVLGWLRQTRDKALAQLGANPVETPESRRWDLWTTRALVRGLWKTSIPRYSVLWLSEPDASQHATAPGSPNALAALRAADQRFAELIQALKDRGVYEQTDILVVSDHGFSTVDHGPDLVTSLKDARFVAGTSFSNPEAGDVLLVKLGGSILLYVFERHQPTVERLVEFLQGTDFAGVIFSRVALPGTFPLTLGQVDTGSTAPDVVVSMRWKEDRNVWGIPGTMAAVGGRVGSGAHGSLSRFDMNNTLIAAGPGFRSGLVSELPSGNLDLAPTVLALLGIERPASMDGRVLVEALAGAAALPAPPKVETETFTASRELGYRRWMQTLTVSRVGGVTYLDQGNGEATLK